ncbi:MAG TPA: TetR/AcrR family transcriptional regulator [Oligoflexia bacterium]|nr:TetR/AcrR family transcriptional regulator [Oligoflexia bacterium]HMR25010.1 TetR/AcrR family transcriptional regulator [Oligoflexia bacterium]
MARRSDHTREELSQLAIQIGHEMMALKGYREFSIRQVAKNMGYTVGTIYNLFGSYNQFVLRVNAMTLDKLYHFVSETKATDFPPATAYPGRNQKNIKELAKAYIDFAHKNFHAWTALFEFNLPQGEVLPNYYQAKIHKLFDLVEQSLVDHTLDQEHAQSMAKVIWASIHGICQLGLTGKLEAVGAESIGQMTDLLINQVLVGLKMLNKKEEY